jgi:hypothetical protein
MSPPSLFLFDTIFRFRLQLLPFRHFSSRFRHYFHFLSTIGHCRFDAAFADYFAIFSPLSVITTFDFLFAISRYFDISFHIDHFDDAIAAYYHDVVRELISMMAAPLPLPDDAFTPRYLAFASRHFDADAGFRRLRRHFDFRHFLQIFSLSRHRADDTFRRSADMPPPCAPSRARYAFAMLTLTSPDAIDFLRWRIFG